MNSRNTPPPARPAASPRSRFALLERPVLALLCAALVTVRCGGDAQTGPGDPRSELRVSVTTTGEDIDPDGYTATIDGSRSVSIPSNGSATFTGLPAGSHTVELSDVATNCIVNGPNPRTVVVQANTSASAGVTVSCDGLRGDLEISVSTTGDDLDPDGYEVTVIQVAAQPPAATAGLSASPSAANESAEVVRSRRELSGFGVTEDVDSGQKPATAAEGPAQQQVGVSASESKTIPTNGSVMFTELPDGMHTVALSGLAGNCALTSTNPATVEVPADSVASLTFTIDCTPLVGGLEVSVATTGDDPDPDGYTVTVDGSVSQAVGINGTAVFNGLDDGSHVVELTGVAPNCTVTGPNPITVDIPANGSATTNFTVNCVASLGDLQITTSTSGPDQDPDGYTVTIDSTLAQAVSVNGTTTVTGLTTGDHVVELSDLAGNCSVVGANPATVTVLLSDTASVNFTVTCGDRIGDLEVSVTTSGTDPDPDGYTVTVDGTLSQAIDSAGVVTFTGLAEGDHSVSLSGVAGNCSVTGANPATATVPFGGTATVSFAVSCSDRTGDLDVSVFTTGEDQDPDGYTVVVDGGPSQTVGVNGTVTFVGLAEGSHAVQLLDVRSNCTVTGDNPVTVAVAYGGTASTTFQVSCSDRTGDLDVSVSTTGQDVDPDGYTVTVDGTQNQAIGTSGTVSFTSLAEGAHSVELSGLAGNCSVNGANPDSVTVPFSGTATTTFLVDCVTRTGDLEVTASTTGADMDPDGYTVTVDGGWSQVVVTNGSVTFTGLTEGDHTVELSGAAGNCTITSANPTTAAVPFAATATTAFTIDCVTRTGDLDVSASTTGVDIDPDGYTVVVDGSQSQAISVNGSVTFTALTEGDHTVELTDLAGNCSVTGGNPVTVAVPYAGSTATSFAVNCVERLGDLQVNTSTSGADLDPDGYTVTVDGTQTLGITANGSITFTGLDEGNHTVELAGVADNCTVTSANPVTSTVPFAETATTTFTINCVDRVGDLEVTVSTTGADLDPNGYRVSLDGGAGRPVTVNDTTTFTGITEGDHNVTLTDVAANCTVTSGNSVTVTVPFGGTATTAFTIDCSDRTGDLSVTTATTGVDLDTLYTITVDQTQSQTAGSNATVTFVGLSEGTHTVRITGIAGNCTVNGERTVAVSVPFQGTATHTYNISCTERLGDLEVRASTSGQDVDPDGYTVTVDGTQSQAIGINGTVSFLSLDEGDHTVELSSLAGNCTVSGANPVTVSVPFADTATTTFTINCVTRTGNLDVSVTTTGVDLDPDGYSVLVDGSPSGTVATNGSVTLSGLTEGDHSVALGGLAGNCSVTSATPVAVTIPFNGTASTSFTVNCIERLGDLQVTASSTGDDLDPDGYTVTVDGTQSQTIATNGSITFTGLTEGDHTVELSGLAGNCTVTSTNPVTVTVPYASTATTTFAIDCVTRTGDLDVSVTTTGVDVDPDGYVVVVDGSQNQSVTINGSVTFTALAEGDHSVELTGVAGNCAVAGANPVTVAVPYAGTASTSFTVNCAERLGNLRVAASTTGEDQDPNGYSILLDGVLQSDTLAINGSLVYTDLDEGNHTVELTGLDNNCSVTSTNPVTVNVPYADTATTSFSVDCAPLLGNLDVTVATAGDSLDPDGYTITVDGAQSQAITINGTVSYVDLDDGPHSVELTGNRANCTVNETNPATANVPPNGTGTQNWTVSCVPYEGSLQVNITTTGADLDPDGYTVRIGEDPLTDQSSLITDVLTFNDLPVGSHTIDIRDRADNCVVAGGNPSSGTVQYNVTTSVNVQVICLAFEQTLVGAGDITDADTIGAGQTATLLDAIAPTATVFTLGDHVATGTASEFTNLYNPTWGRHRANTKPAPGNHEYDATVNAGPYFDYFGSEAGNRGEGWYAYNRGSWRIIVLNSWLPHGPGSAQFTWLTNELQNNAKFCTLAYWHSPRFSSGEQTAPGDTTMQAVWDSLYAHGVELVMNGDAHLYERFARQDPNGNVDTQFGIRQITAGTGGSAYRNLRPAGPLPNSQVQIINTWGVVKILLHETSYTWEFIEAPNAGTPPLDSGTDSCHGRP